MQNCDLFTVADPAGACEQPQSWTHTLERTGSNASGPDPNPSLSFLLTVLAAAGYLTLNLFMT